MSNDVENSFIHTPYSHEKRLLAAIKNGKPDDLDNILNEELPGHLGTLSYNDLRQEIYMGIVETTIACRAAIEGGIHSEIAYHLSDVTIQELDRCKDPAAAKKISREMMNKYATLVKELIESESDVRKNPSNNPHIAHCKNYVSENLQGKLTVREIADAIGLEENYLSALFKNCESITLSQYILKEKIKLAKNLLAHSDYSFVDIASYLGFASQSHFGASFKKITGMTPRAYRLENK